MTWTLILKVNSVYYRVVRLTPDPTVAKAAIELQKPDGKKYHVSLTRHGYECTCGDWNWRKRNTKEVCKHIGAARDSGLL